jgi:hypothetical protein
MGVVPCEQTATRKLACHLLFLKLKRDQARLNNKNWEDRLPKDGGYMQEMWLA